MEAVTIDIPKDFSLMSIKPKSELNELKKRHKPYLISFDDPIIDIPPLIGVLEDLGRVQPLLSLSNISCIKGKAKSRKSFGISLLLSAYFWSQRNEGNFQDKLVVNLPTDKNKWGALMIDTEQAKADLQRCMHRIPKLSGFTPDNLYVYQLRKAATIEERLLLTLEAIELYKDEISFVVVDGIADLGKDINDRSEFLAIILQLMALTDKHNIHVLSVLHENKSGTDARGHAGTEITNKSESVLQFTKHPDLGKYTTIIKGEYTRGMGFEDFSFTIDDNGLPIIDDIDKVHTKKKDQFDILPESYEPKQHTDVLKNKSNLDPANEYSRQDICDRIKSGWHKYGIKLSVRKLTTFLNYYLDTEIIIKSGKDRSPKQKYMFNAPNLYYNGWCYNDL